MNEWLEKLRDWLEAHGSWKLLGVAFLVVAVVAFCGGNMYEDWRAKGEGLTLVDEAPTEADAPTSTTAKQTEAPTATTSAEVVVHVDGAVTAPGVYTLKGGARVDDAVRAAGAKADADLSQLNLAQLLTDGQKIIVPLRGETAPAETTQAPASTTASASSDGTPSGKININSATQEELMTLPNIGEVRAKAIIEYRKNNGPFKSIENLKDVSGIGDKLYADAEPYITV